MRFPLTGQRRPRLGGARENAKQRNNELGPGASPPVISTRQSNAAVCLCFSSFFFSPDPSLRHQKCMRFNPDATVWVAKQRILCSLNQSLKDVLNYGLFQPPSDGRDGKFLDEERLLREYPQPISKGVPALEVGPASEAWRSPPGGRSGCGRYQKC